MNFGLREGEKCYLNGRGMAPPASQNRAPQSRPAHYMEGMRILYFLTETSHKLKDGYLRHWAAGIYSYWPVDYSKPVDKEGDLERSIANMKKVAKVAEECDVVLGMEVLNRFEGYLLNTCDEAIRYVDAVGSKNVRIMLDTFHMSIEEDNIAAAIRKAGDKLCHLHLGERNRKVPGKGTMPWDEIGQALRDINYQHAAVMEPFVMPGGTIGSEVKVWRNLVEDTSEAALDADAKNSLQFVKHVFGL